MGRFYLNPYICIASELRMLWTEWRDTLVAANGERNTMAQNDRFAGPVNDDWLAQHIEPALEPSLPIVDPHHHLWARDSNT